MADIGVSGFRLPSSPIFGSAPMAPPAAKAPPPAEKTAAPNSADSFCSGEPMVAQMQQMTKFLSTRIDFAQLMKDTNGKPTGADLQKALASAAQALADHPDTKGEMEKANVPLCFDLKKNSPQEVRNFVLGVRNALTAMATRIPNRQ